MHGRPVTIYISLGSNIDPVTNLQSATSAIFEKLDDCKISPVYRSEAVGMQGADFYNAVISGSTRQSLNDVTDWLLDTENVHGRVRTENKFTDRTLDLDLLLYGNYVTDARSNTAIDLPSPEITTQAYVLQPLADIAGALVHPQHHYTIEALLRELQVKSPDKFTSLYPVSL